MAFPSTSVLTTFDGGDEDPLSEGGNWAGPTDLSGETAQLEIVSNQVTCNAAAIGSSHWLGGTYGPSCEVFATIATIPGAAAKSVILSLRLANIGTDTTDGYSALFQNAGPTDQAVVYRVDDGAITPLGTVIPMPELVNGDVCGARMLGNTVFLFKNGVGIGSRTDTTYTAAGRIGAAGTDDTYRLDSFGGGTCTVRPERVYTHYSQMRT